MTHAQGQDTPLRTTALKDHSQRWGWERKWTKRLLRSQRKRKASPKYWESQWRFWTLSNASERSSLRQSRRNRRNWGSSASLSLLVAKMLLRICSIGTPQIPTRYWRHKPTRSHQWWSKKTTTFSRLPRYLTSSHRTMINLTTISFKTLSPLTY